MRRFIFTFFLVIPILTLPVAAKQHRVETGPDSLQAKGNWSHFAMNVTPAASLIATSALWNDYANHRNIHISGHDMHTPGLKSADYIQYAPLALIYIPKLFGLEGRLTWKEMLLTQAGTFVATFGLTQGLKYSFGRLRPDESARNSYPSGHSVTAFLLAHMLHKEYGETVSPWFSVAGYSIATATGIMRVCEQRHHISDVLCGAGIGIFMAEIGYTICDCIRHRGNSNPLLNLDRDLAVRNWDFSMNSAYYFGISKFNGILPENFQPGYSLGFKGVRMFCRHFGASARIDFTQMAWKNQQVKLADGAYFSPIISSEAGLAARFPLTGFLVLGADAMAGASYSNTYHFTDLSSNAIDISIPTRFTASTELNLTFNSADKLGIRAFAGYKHINGTLGSFYTGTAVNLSF